MQRLNSDCLAPPETSNSLGENSRPLSRRNFVAIAALSSALPSTGVYRVLPALMAAIAASLIGSGVSKSGSPAPKLMMSTPSRLRAVAFDRTAPVADGLMRVRRFETDKLKGLPPEDDLMVRESNILPKNAVDERDRLALVSDYAPAGDQVSAIAGLVEGLDDGLARQILLGVTGSGKTFTMASVIEQLQRPAIVLAPNKTLAAQLYGEMRDFFPNNAVEYFVSYYDYYQPEAYVPSSDTYIEKDASINQHLEQMRLSATKALIERRDTIIVATVSAIYGLGDPEAYFSMVMHLVRGDRTDQRTILRRLAELQYTRNEMELAQGTYRVRGDVIDIFPAESEREAVRVELFDDEIESLAYFDPLTGEVLRRVARLTVFPKTHYVTPRERLLEACELIKVELKDRLDYLRQHDKLLEAQRLEQRTMFDLEMIRELGYCSGIENYSRYSVSYTHLTLPTIRRGCRSRWSPYH